LEIKTAEAKDLISRLEAFISPEEFGGGVAVMMNHDEAKPGSAPQPDPCRHRTAQSNDE
jgi:hypothetical protein